MNRGLVSSLCAVALVAMVAVQAQAATQLSLNLRYTNPANPSQGGTWTLVALTDDADGIAGINAILDFVDNTGVALQTGIGAIDPIDQGGANERPAYLNTANGIDLIYGQDIANGPVVSGVGTASAPAAAKVGTSPSFTDPLLNPSWNGATKIATGTFGGTRPAWVNTTDANELVGTTGAIQATSLSTTVRGDSMRSLGLETTVANGGLLQGDANRNGVVNSADLGLLLANFNGTATGWGQGNFNNTAGAPNTVTNSADLGLLLSNFNATQIPVSIGAVPEPASLALGAASLFGLFALRRRSI